MNAIAATKSRALNHLEGFALLALLQGLPTIASIGLTFKLFAAGLVANISGPVIALAILSYIVAYALLVSWLGPKYPHPLRGQYDPVLFDARLSLREKIARWRSGHYGSLRLVNNVWRLSMLAVALLILM